MEHVLQERAALPGTTAAAPEGSSGLSSLGEKWGKLMQEAEARWVRAEAFLSGVSTSSPVCRSGRRCRAAPPPCPAAAAGRALTMSVRGQRLCARPAARNGDGAGPGLVQPGRGRLALCPCVPVSPCPCVPVSPCPCVPAPWTLSPRCPQRVPGADGGMPASPLAVRGEAQPSSPTFPAQVRPPGADPAGSTELPGSRGLLPGVARCHRAAAGPALACQRLRQPCAGSPPANPGQGGHGHGGTGHRGSREFGHGEGWDGESSRCHRSLPPRPSARRSAPGWRSWKESWRAGSGSCRW